jgi:hypothetical protein
MTIEQIIQSKIGILPEQKQAEVLNFVNFLIASQTEINPEQESDVQPKLKRVLGLNKGEISTSEDFNNPLCLEHSIEQAAPTQTHTEHPHPSFAEAAHEFIGCLDSDIEDLSHNPQYLEGFGK